MASKTDELTIKHKLVTAAISLYTEENENFSIATLAKKTRIKKAEIFKIFPSKRAILNYYYSLCLMRYRNMVIEIDDF